MFFIRFALIALVAALCSLNLVNGACNPIPAASLNGRHATPMTLDHGTAGQAHTPNAFTGYVWKWQDRTVTTYYYYNQNPTSDNIQISGGSKPITIRLVMMDNSLYHYEVDIHGCNLNFSGVDIARVQVY